MVRKFFFGLLLSGSAIFGGCKSVSQSRLATPTPISEGESIDLRKHRATACEMAGFRDDLGSKYPELLKEMRLLKEMQMTGKPKNSETPNIYRLFEEEQVAIFHFAGGGFRDVNRALHKGDLQGLSKHVMFTKVLSSALNKLPPFVGRAYRVGNLPNHQPVRLLKPGQDPNKIDPEHLAQFKVGGVIDYPGFMSTSLLNFDQLAILGYKCSEAKYTIHSKFGREITSFSPSAQEREILFVPGSKFNIKKLEVSTPPGNGCPSEVVHIELVEIQLNTQ